MGAHVDDRLAFVDAGPSPSAQRLVCVHGFTQTSQAWGPFDELLGHHRALRLVDAPGHGTSTHAAADLVAAARLVTNTGGRADYLGYSMGGRIVLRAAIDHPGQVQRLVLIGATPGIADARERAERAARDDALATHLCSIGVEAFIDEWLAQPLFAGLDARTAHRDARLANTAAALAASLRAAGTGAQEPLWDRLCELTMPVLVIAGASDQKFGAIARDMADAIGNNASVVRIDGAGHTAHLEQPERTATVVLDWLAATD